MAKRRPIPVGMPGHLTPSQWLLVFFVPVLALVALVVGVIVDGRAQAGRDERDADARVELLLTNTLATEGKGALAADPDRAWICDEVRARAAGEAASVEPYTKISQDMALRLLRDLC